MTLLLLAGNRTSSSLEFNFGSLGAGETTFQLEINRSSDFKSDISLVKNGITSVTTMQDLPSGTQFFARMRSTNLPSLGAWSNTVGIATLAAAVDNSFTGFSVDKALLVVPQESSNYELGSTALAGYPVTNLARDDPSSVMITPPGGTTIRFDATGSGIDCIAILGTMSASGQTWRIMSFLNPADRLAQTNVQFDTGFIPFRCSPTIGARPSYHALHLLPAPRTEMFWLINIANTNQQFVARNLVFGQAITSVNASRGSGSSPQDFGSVQRNRFGTPNRVIGWRGRSVDFELSWLNEAEYHAKYAALDTIVGTTRPVLAIANSKRNVFLNDRIAFGRIEQTRAEVVRSGKHSKSLKIESLY